MERKVNLCALTDEERRRVARIIREELLELLEKYEEGIEGLFIKALQDSHAPHIGADDFVIINLPIRIVASRLFSGLLGEMEK